MMTKTNTDLKSDRFIVPAQGCQSLIGSDAAVDCADVHGEIIYLLEWCATALKMGMGYNLH